MAWGNATVVHSEQLRDINIPPRIVISEHIFHETISEYNIDVSSLRYNIRDTIKKLLLQVSFYNSEGWYTSRSSKYTFSQIKHGGNEFSTAVKLLFGLRGAYRSQKDVYDTASKLLEEIYTKITDI